MRSYDELLEASGYARRPRDFDTLLAILGTELRLITPTDPRGPDPDDDLNSPAITPGVITTSRTTTLSRRCANGSTARSSETIAGRAAIRLAERTAEWTARRSRRYLPSWWEWLVIVLFTRRSRRSPAERRLVRAATRYHAARVAVAAAAVVLVSFFAAERLGAARARTRCASWRIAEGQDVPRCSRTSARPALGGSFAAGDSR